MKANRMLMVMVVGATGLLQPNLANAGAKARVKIVKTETTEVDLELDLKAEKEPVEKPDAPELSEREFKELVTRNATEK